MIGVRAQVSSRRRAGLSGTNGDPQIAHNRRLESFALPIHERGHLPIVGEWMALVYTDVGGLPLRRATP
jgi:hypothetical protein